AHFLPPVLDKERLPLLGLDQRKVALTHMLQVVDRPAHRVAVLLRLPQLRDLCLQCAALLPTHLQGSVHVAERHSTLVRRRSIMGAGFATVSSDPPNVLDRVAPVNGSRLALVAAVPLRCPPPLQVVAGLPLALGVALPSPVEHPAVVQAIGAHND